MLQKYRTITKNKIKHSRRMKTTNKLKNNKRTVNYHFEIKKISTITKKSAFSLKKRQRKSAFVDIQAVRKGGIRWKIMIKVLFSITLTTNATNIFRLKWLSAFFYALIISSFSSQPLTPQRAAVIVVYMMLTDECSTLPCTRGSSISEKCSKWDFLFFIF